MEKRLAAKDSYIVGSLLRERHGPCIPPIGYESHRVLFDPDEINPEDIARALEGQE